MIISNTDAKVWMALKNRISVWSECAVHLPEANYNPQADDAFLVVQHLTTEYGGTVPVSMKCGEPITGILNISVMHPVDFGFDSHIGRASRVADFFVNAPLISYSDVKVRLNGRPRVIWIPELQTPWNRIEVQIPWVAWG